jgi:hypothetical protein
MRAGHLVCATHSSMGMQPADPNSRYCAQAMKFCTREVLQQIKPRARRRGLAARPA